MGTSAVDIRLAAHFLFLFEGHSNVNYVVAGEGGQHVLGVTVSDALHRVGVVTKLLVAVLHLLQQLGGDPT
jgi:hypothetical protein